MKKYLFVILSPFFFVTPSQAQTDRCIRPIKVIVEFKSDKTENISKIEWIDKNGVSGISVIDNKLTNLFFNEEEKNKRFLTVSYDGNKIISVVPDCK